VYLQQTLYNKLVVQPVVPTGCKMVLPFDFGHNKDIPIFDDFLHTDYRNRGDESFYFNSSTSPTSPKTGVLQPAAVQT